MCGQGREEKDDKDLNRPRQDAEKITTSDGDLIASFRETSSWSTISIVRSF